MRNSKKILLILVLILVFGTTTAFAAEGDIFLKSDNSLKYLSKQMQVDRIARKNTQVNENKFKIEVRNKLYDLTAANAAFRQDKNNWKDILTGASDIKNRFELEQYLQFNFGTLNTVIGTTKFRIRIDENDKVYNPEDYTIKLYYEYDFFEGAMNSIRYTNEQKQQLKKQLRDHMEDVARKGISLMPHKKMRGFYLYTLSTYPDIQVLRHYSWKNYEGSIVSAPYESTKLSRFMWEDIIDDKL